MVILILPTLYREEPYILIDILLPILILFTCLTRVPWIDSIQQDYPFTKAYIIRPDHVTLRITVIHIIKHFVRTVIFQV